jgi:18S rRNA (adenine1779-N6/adenine1780-N6)-dimethyltransferase
MNVNFLEWDGLIRLCFSRKNKTLGAIFRQASTLALMHQNYLLCQALAAPGASTGGGAGTVAGNTAAHAGIPPSMDLDDDDNMSEEGGDDDVMDVDEDEEGAIGQQKVRCAVFPSGPTAGSACMHAFMQSCSVRQYKAT